MNVSIIGLARMPERAARVGARLDALGIAHEVFPAIDGTQGEHLAWKQYDEAACLRAFGSGLLPQEIGCFASHFSLWQRSASEGVPVLVLEDDVTLLDGFPEVVELARARLQDYHLIRLSGLFDQPYRLVEDLGRHELVRFLRGPQGTQAYALAPEGAAALIRAATSWREPVDHFLDRFWLHGVQPHAILPFEVVHEEAAEQASTIGLRTKKRRGWNKIRRELNKLRDQLSRRVYNFRY